MQNTGSPKAGTSPKQDKNQRLTYKDIEHIVEYLVKVKARDNTFDCWDVEDIAQEIRIICLNALQSFEADRATDQKTITNYFGRCVDNRLQNLKRDNYIRFTPPFSKARVKEIEENPESAPSDYAKLEKHRRGIELQKKIKHPASIEAVGEAGDILNVVEGEVAARDMTQYIIDNIDESLRPALITLLAGDKRKVNIRIRRRIQASVRMMLEE